MSDLGPLWPSCFMGVLHISQKKHFFMDNLHVFTNLEMLQHCKGMYGWSTLENMIPKCTDTKICFNSAAQREVKIVYNFGLSEFNMVKV